MSKAKVADPTKIVKNNTAWSGALTFTFLTSTPDYYPEDYVSGIGAMDRSNPSLIHTYRETNLFRSFNDSEMNSVRLLYFGDAAGQRFGVSDVALATVSYVTDPNDAKFSFGALKYDLGSATGRIYGYANGIGASSTLEEIQDYFGFGEYPDEKIRGDLWLFDAGIGGVKLERNTARQLIERQRPVLRRPRLGS
jgi:hypothetical protein